MRHADLVRATSMTARLDANGQLEPVAVDETLTTELFAPARGEAPGLHPDEGVAASAGLSTSDAQATLFELA